ncbi:hypothetical protein V1509DRAFT_661441 [Lipomyces kononenkoae]
MADVHHIIRVEPFQGSFWPAILIASFACFGGILYGYDTGYISGIAMDHFKQVFATVHDALGNPIFTSSQTSLIVSIQVGEVFGDERMFISFSYILMFVFALGVALQAASSSIALFAVDWLIFGLRTFFAGLGLGVISAVVPLYQSEAAPKLIRGSIVAGYQWKYYHRADNRPDTGAYRIAICIQFAWGLILAGGMLILPDSLPPDHEYVSEQLLVIMTVQALQQLSGINFIFYYGTDFFQKSGITNPFIISMVTNIVNVVIAPPCLYMVERIGRRKLLLVGAAGMYLAEYIVAIVGVSVSSVVANKVLISFVCVYIACFAATWGPVAWVVTGETFSLRTRSIFFIWGTFCLFAVGFVYMFVYEVKGLSLEDIDELFEKDAKHAEAVVDAEKVGAIQIEHV